MLTKDLLRFRIAKGELKPSFIDPTQPRLRAIAEELLALYDVEMGASRTEIDEGVMGIVNSTRDIKLAKGLNKLISDRCEFSHGGDYDHRAFRAELFAESAKLLKTPHKFSEYAAAIESTFAEHTDRLGDIYGDHPECELLTEMKPITPEQLLDRYNVALVQSLLIQCRSVEITLIEPDTAKLRRLFQYLKFFRLLADVKFNPARPYRLDLTIAGPGSVLENVNKYGLQLASFFPALIAMKTWQISAEIPQERGAVPMVIDQESNLVSHYRFSSYLPPEIKAFHDEFGAKCSDWIIEDQVNFLTLNDGTVIFPDFQFRHKSGKTVSLELFHRWHESPLLTRIAQEPKLATVPLIIGVDRAVARKPHIAESLEPSLLYQTRGFQFNDFPAISVVKKVLDSMI